jgi:uncharacterized protein (TIGR02678 family)
MTTASFYSAELADQQRGFTGLLARPLVAPWTDPELFSLVARYEQRLGQWCRRLGYRLVRIDQSYRMRRVPIEGSLAVPRGVPPPRRHLVLALVAAAVLEDERADSITLQDISDAVRRFASANGLRAYDPDQRRHRQDLVEALRLLIGHGVLEQRTWRADLIQSWQDQGTGIGAGYLIHRDALVLLVDTHDTEVALAPPSPGEADTRSARLLRLLVETQFLEPARLTAGDTAYLTAQRHRLVLQAQEMTGGVVEVRQDLWTLVFPSDQGLDPAVLVGFPEPTAADWASLGLLDAAARLAEVTPGGRRALTSAQWAGLAERFHAEHGHQLTLARRDSPTALQTQVTARLAQAGLIEAAPDGALVLLPAAARFRDAALEGPRTPASAAPAPDLLGYAAQLDDPGRPDA